MGRYRVSMDIGDTFTDVVVYREDSGTYAAGKASTRINDIAMTPEYREMLAAFGPDIVFELEKTGLRFDPGVDS